MVIIPFFLVLILFQIFWFLKKNILGLIISTFIFQSLVYLSAVYYLIPRLDKLWVSEKINTVISQNYYQVDKVLHFGFNEPSLIFLTSHKSKKKNLKEYKNEILSQKILYIVSDEYSDFVNDETFSDFKLIDEFNGFNYSQGKNIVIKFFLNQ